MDFMNFGKKPDKLYSAQRKRRVDTEPACAFCRSQDTALTIEGVDICEYHVAVIKDTIPAKRPLADIGQFGLQRGNKHIVQIGDMGRTLIPDRFCRQLNIKDGDKFTPLVHITKKFMELFVKEDGNIRLDGYSRILIPQYLLSHLEWGMRDKLSVTLDPKVKMIRLTLEDKYVPKCVFCGSNDIALTLQERDICRKHLQEVQQST